ncbi:2'-phosphotransferase [Leucobacter sp. OH2974_COT-288]|nr:2'-phosphotransferase [Leucobacter sp. OH2974_COT-288]
MASIPLTFAALATSAVPNLYPLSARKHSLAGDANFTAAVVSCDSGDVIVRVPSHDAAAAQQAAENIALSALTAGARSQLPFLVPTVLGITRAGEWPATVATFLPGEKFNTADLRPDAILLASLAGALEALHQLPSSLLSRVGLPVRSAEMCRVEAARLVTKAWQTKRLPVAIKERWEQVLREVTLWDFQPVTIHGDVTADSFLVDADSVTAMLGFAELSVGDPAIDFAWLCAAPAGVLHEVLIRYAESTSQDLQKLLYRAHFYHELELAKWLLHGVETHDPEIIADAENLLDMLVDRAVVPILPPAAAPLSEWEVQHLLDATEHVKPQATHLNDTQQLQLLDDERVFNSDTDFIDPVSAAHADTAEPRESDSAPRQD